MNIFLSVALKGTSDLLQGKEMHMPPQFGTFKTAQRIQQAKPQAEQIASEFQEESMSDKEEHQLLSEY